MEKISVHTHITSYSFEELPVQFQQLVESAKAQTKNAYAPYSHFHVGSAALLENGEILGANNQENLAYPSGLCAERVNIFFVNANYPTTTIVAMAVAATFGNNDFTDKPVIPCGACLQVLAESERRQNSPIALLFYGKEKIYQVSSVKECLPLCFEL